MADGNSIDCLPQYRPSQVGSFFSFISPDLIMAQFDGEFLVFNKQGDFKGKVEFGLPPELILSSLTLRCCCEEKKFFVFEGPPIRKE